MLRVRNSFLQFDHGAPSGAQLRSRSLEAEGTRSTFAHPFEEEVLGRLNEVIYTGLIPEPLSEPKNEALPEPVEADQAAEGVVEQITPEVAEKPEPASALKTVQSNSSVSTMAPTEHFEDEREEADPWQQAFDEYGQHIQYGIGPKTFQHLRVPRSLNMAEEFSKAHLEGPPTTMMIRNIPNRYSQRELMGELEKLGFAGTFDFFYAPIDTGTMGNVGYAFVNFVDHACAARCQQVVTGYSFKKHQQKTRRKVATVSVAHLQGLEANIRHYQNSAVNGRNRSKRCGPVIMTNISTALPCGGTQ